MPKELDPIAVLNNIPSAGTIDGKKSLPPVHLWNPEVCIDGDIRISADGQWHHQGSVITRQRMVNLFSTVLRRDDEEYFLVTPVEKVKVRVDDAPFIAQKVDVMSVEGKVSLRFTTNVGEQVAAGKEHAIRVVYQGGGREPRPYIHVRSGLDALIARSVFYQLVDLAEEGMVAGKSVWLLKSNGESFILGEIE